jgi:hypothetical protein
MRPSPVQTDFAMLRVSVQTEHGFGQPCGGATSACAVTRLAGHDTRGHVVPAPRPWDQGVPLDDLDRISP